MDHHIYGTKNKRGDWRPNDALRPSPMFAFPPEPIRFLKWLPHYFLPWNILFMAMAVSVWLWLTPGVETMKTLTWSWPALILARNLVAVFLFYGTFELRLYIRRSQNKIFKFNAKWPSENPSEVFMLSSQNKDNMLRGFGFGVPIWTAYEVLIFWAFSNGWVPWLNWTDNVIWLAIFGLLIPVIHELHFFCIHRLIHIPVLYKWIHSVHHNSVNPSPWSSLSMHPVEHLLYWSGSLIHLLVPSHPVLALYHLHLAGFGAVVGHVGFDKIVVSDETAIDCHAYAHYLHHKYFEVNYADGLLPLDQWFGTWHDGTEHGDNLMKERLRLRKSRQK